MKILTNHMGYSALGYKKVVIQCEDHDQPEMFAVVDAEHRVMFESTLCKIGAVARWNKGTYFVGEFSDFQIEGVYRIKVGEILSNEFEISTFLLSMRMINAVAYYFKAQRSSGEWFLEDSDLPFKGDREGKIDVHGGWFDATGDYGIHLSHLSHSSYYNPQQMPFSTYTFFKVHEFLHNSGNECYSMLKRRLLDEGYWGADFLMRMHAPSGSFFRSINRSGALDAVKGSRFVGFEYHRSSAQFSDVAETSDEEVVLDENYETSFRSGGGLAIAALAIAGRNYYPASDYGQDEYIQCAKSAWHYLMESNNRYTNDGSWNLVDEYCALIATCEVYLTTQEYEYLSSSRDMASRIYARTTEVAQGMRRLDVVEGLPFSHASDEGMPIVALVQYSEMEPDAMKRNEAIRYAEEIMRWKLSLTDSVPNPFGYPRLESIEHNKIVGKFFFSHSTSVSPWWQGDNARIASIASAAKKIASVTKDSELSERCLKMAQDPIDWIMGLNPFDSSMIEGYGRNNIQYFFKNRYDFLNCPGGVVNGITSGLDDEDGIEFVQEPNDRIDDNWRWAEQWLPHASWYLFAMALKNE